MLVAKIISGGQTGVDRGALEAALWAGFPYGGLMPKCRMDRRRTTRWRNWCKGNHPVGPDSDYNNQKH